MNKNIYTIAIDFDGTICLGGFPDISKGKLNVNLINEIEYFINQLEKMGYDVKLILWTCRENIPEGDYLNQALEFCRQNNILFDAVNENLWHDFSIKYPNKVRKMYADLYVDDHNYINYRKTLDTIINL